MAQLGGRTWWAGVALAALTAACGSTVVSTGGSGGGAGDGGGAAGGSGGSGGSAGSGGAGGAGASAGAGGAAQSGDCATDADCAGAPCVEVVPGGFRVCGESTPEATSCTNPDFDQCCTSADCAEGACYPFGALPYCGGPQPVDQNQCLSDLCQTDAQCFAPQRCLPAGVFGFPVRTCLSALCGTDADCTAKAGGVCAPVDNPCCNTVAGLACVYPDGCRTNADCAVGYCALEGDQGVCKNDGGPFCPA
jgi:hypothetical protein